MSLHSANRVNISLTLQCRLLVSAIVWQFCAHPDLLTKTRRDFHDALGEAIDRGKGPPESLV
jgi:hypothetical protein